MIEEGIFQLLTSNSSVNALIENRVYPLILPEHFVSPSVTYQLISTVGTYTMDGPVGLVKSRVQIDVWATDYGKAKAVAAAIRAALDGFFGELSDGTFVSNTMMDGATDYFEKESRLARVQTDWVFLYAQ